MSQRLLVSGLLLLLAAGVMQVAVEVVRAANVGVTASGGAFQDGDGDENTTIAAGDTVTWTFADGQPHTVTSDAGAFDSGAEQVGGTYAFTFNTPGSFGYYCKVHGLPGQGMHGTVTVQAAATNTAPAATNTPDATNTRTPTRTFTSTPPATGTVTVAPTTVASTPTPFEAVPINATEPAPPRGGAGQSVIAPAVGSGDGGSGDGFRTETLMIALIVVGALMIAGAGVARLRG